MYEQCDERDVVQVTPVDRIVTLACCCGWCAVCWMPARHQVIGPPLRSSALCVTHRTRDHASTVTHPCCCAMALLVLSCLQLRCQPLLLLLLPPVRAMLQWMVDVMVRDTPVKESDRTSVTAEKENAVRAPDEHAYESAPLSEAGTCETRPSTEKRKLQLLLAVVPVSIWMQCASLCCC